MPPLPLFPHALPALPTTVVPKGGGYGKVREGAAVEGPGPRPACHSVAGRDVGAFCRCCCCCCCDGGGAAAQLSRWPRLGEASRCRQSKRAASICWVQDGSSRTCCCCCCCCCCSSIVLWVGGMVALLPAVVVVAPWDGGGASNQLLGRAALRTACSTCKW